MSGNITYVKGYHTKHERELEPQVAYELGYTHVVVSQSGYAYYDHKIAGSWGTGSYLLKSDGTFLECVNYNFDSSD